MRLSSHWVGCCGKDFPLQWSRKCCDFRPPACACHSTVKAGPTKRQSGLQPYPSCYEKLPVAELKVRGLGHCAWHLAEGKARLSYSRDSGFRINHWCRWTWAAVVWHKYHGDAARSGANISLRAFTTMIRHSRRGQPCNLRSAAGVEQ